MRKYILIIALLLLGVTQRVHAQYDKTYFFYVGRSFIIESRYQDAIETLNVLLRADDKAYEGYFLRGIAKYNLNDLVGAEQDLSRAIETNPVYTMAYHYRALARSMLGNYDDALRDFQEAIDLRPDVPGPYFSRGVTYLLSQQFTRAVADFTTFIRYEGKFADAYLNRGICFLNLKDTTRAYADYDQAIRINREHPMAYARRGTLLQSQKRYEEALSDFDQSIACDSTFVPSYFNRALLYASTKRPVKAIADFDKVLQLDSTSSITYFNRAIIRTQIGDYNRALTDYDQVARYSPGNVLLYFNRASLQAQLGNYPAAITDYTRAIELYPDFANAYLGRSSLRYMTNDLPGSKEDKRIAERKIAEYRAKLNDSTFSIYADTSRRFNQLLSFDSALGGGLADQGTTHTSSDIVLMPMFRFNFMQADSVPMRTMYYVRAQEQFQERLHDSRLRMTRCESDFSPEELIAMDRALEDTLRRVDEGLLLFKRAITQSLIRQYTSAISLYTAAIDREPSNPFFYINRSTTQAEMVDFISSIDNSYQNIAIDSDPANRLRANSGRTYNYDEALADLNKAAKLMPDFAYIYYNRGNLLCRSGFLPSAIEEYTRAIELNPNFAEAYYNRGLLQIFLKDTDKGCLDLSKAGELGISEAYTLLKRYTVKK